MLRLTSILRGRPVETLVLVLKVAAFTLIGCGDTTTPPPMIEVIEEWVGVLPDSFEVAGASVADGPGVVLWSRSEPNLLVISWEPPSVRQWRRVAVGVVPLAAALMPGSGEFEVLDTVSSSLLLFDSSGAVKKVRPVWIPHGVDAAVSWLGSWFLGAPLPDSSYGVYRLGTRPDSPIFWFRTPGGARRPKVDLGTLSGHEDGLLLTSRFFPFVNFVIDARGGLLRQFTPQVSLELPYDSLEALQGRMFSTRTLPL
ncbi:MAG: hypothetical protein KJZ47_10290, partial [Gemmatimonadales bacterium]|nr:hypothetical protein [Gemmatimonadales bacterium]